MIFKYIGDFNIDFSGAGFQSEGHGNEIQWGNAVQLGDSPANLVSCCSWGGNGKTHEQHLSDSPCLGKGRMTAFRTALHLSEQAQLKFNIVYPLPLPKGWLEEKTDTDRFLC